MFWNVFRMESFKIFKRKVLWIGLPLLALEYMLIVGIAFVQEGNQHPETNAFNWTSGLHESLRSTPILGRMLLVVVISLLMAQENSWRTIQLWLSHGVSRGLLFGVKAWDPAIFVIVRRSVGRTGTCRPGAAR